MERNSSRPPIDHLRETDLLRIMESLGYEPSARYSGSFEYELRDGRKLSITPTPRNKAHGPLGIFQVWNGESFEAGKSGGAGAIDLVMTVTGRPFRAALGWLATTFPTQSSNFTPPRRNQPKELLPLLERRLTLPGKHPEALEKVRKYLCQKRGLPPSIIEALIQEETLYANIHRYSSDGQERSFTNAVFVMRADETLTVTGSMIRGCFDGKSPRKSTLPLENGNAAAFWVGESLNSATRIVVTESPIECLSYLAIHRRPGIHSRTYGGSRWRYVETILPAIKEQTGELICAFNNDEAGHEAAAELAQMCYEQGIRFQRHTPKAKDWNDDLRVMPETLELL